VFGFGKWRFILRGIAAGAMLVLSCSCAGVPVVDTPGQKNGIRSYMAQGRSLFEARQYDQALSLFDEAIERYPNEYAPYHGRAWVYLDVGQYEQAMRDFNRAIELNPDFALAWRGRSYVWEEMGRLDEAIKDMKRFMELEPDDRDGFRRLMELEGWFEPLSYESDWSRTDSDKP
jgi:tetratricopeptide (TPR) repeat protein